MLRRGRAICLAIIFGAAALASSCTAIPDSAVNRSALPGYEITSSGRYKVFACVPPECANIRVAVHDRVGLTAEERALFERADAADFQEFGDALRSGFEPYAQLDGDRIRIAGGPERFTVRGKPAAGFRLANMGSGALGNGYLVVFPSGSTLHIVVAVGTSSGTAKSVARTVANALDV